MTNQEKIELAKKIVADNVGKFITIDFIKKDGTLRRMTCHRSKVLEKSCTGNNFEATLKRKNTLEMNGMLCVEELTTDKFYQFRTVNLNTVVRIAASGKIYNFS